jgi:hypothetical protein
MRRFDDEIAKTAVESAHFQHRPSPGDLQVSVHDIAKEDSCSPYEMKERELQGIEGSQKA